MFGKPKTNWANSKPSSIKTPYSPVGYTRNKLGEIIGRHGSSYKSNNLSKNTNVPNV